MNSQHFSLLKVGARWDTCFWIAFFSRLFSSSTRRFDNYTRLVEQMPNLLEVFFCCLLIWKSLLLMSYCRICAYSPCCVFASSLANSCGYKEQLLTLSNIWSWKLPVPYPWLHVLGSQIFWHISRPISRIKELSLHMDACQKGMHWLEVFSPNFAWA